MVLKSKQRPIVLGLIKPGGVGWPGPATPHAGLARDLMFGSIQSAWFGAAGLSAFGGNPQAALGGTPPNADISRDVRVLMKLDPNNFADGTYWMWPGTIASGNPYYGGLIDVTASGGGAYLHPFNASKPRNGWLRIAVWNPGTVEYNGSLTAGGASLSDQANGGGLGGGAYSGPLSDQMAGSYRTMFEGVKWTNMSFLMSGADRLAFRMCDFSFPMSAFKAQYDQVCTLRGVPILSAPADDRYSGPYYNALQSDEFKRNNQATWLRQQGSVAHGACGRIRSLCNDIHDCPNDGHFLGGASGFVSYGDRMWNIYNSVHGVPYPGSVFQDNMHADIVQFIGGEGTSTGRGGAVDIQYLTCAWCDDVEFSAETGSIANVKFGDPANPQNIWIIGNMAAAFIIDATSGYNIDSTNKIGVQWYAAGQDPFGGGYNSSFDAVSISGSPGVVTNFSHVKPAAVRMSGSIAVDPVTDLIVNRVGPADDFRRAYPTATALDAFMSSMGWFD